MTSQAVPRGILPGFARSLGTPALVSAGLVLPFVVLQSMNRRGSDDDFPVTVFVLMWLLAFLFAVISAPIVRGLSARRSAPAVRLVLPRAALLIFIAWLLVSLTADQLPCFLGVPNCD